MEDHCFADGGVVRPASSRRCNTNAPGAAGMPNASIAGSMTKRTAISQEFL